MKNSWFDEIEMSEQEKEELIYWCEIIGYQRYREIHNLLKKEVGVKVPFPLLKTLARYDFNLSDFLHSTIKFVELRFRSYLINHYGDLILTKKEFLYQLSSNLSTTGELLECSTYYDKTLKETCTLTEYLNASSIETVFRLFLILDENRIAFFGPKEQLKEDTEIIRKQRNLVAHGQILIADKQKLNEAIRVLFKYLPSGEAKQHKRIYLENIHEKLIQDISENYSELMQKFFVDIPD